MKTSTRRTLLGWLAAWCLTTGPGVANAQAQPAAEHHADSARWVACSLTLAPQTMPDASGAPAGYATELLLAVSRQLGWQMEVRYMPWLRVVSEAQAGRCDLVYTVLRRPDYERFLLFPSTPVLLQTNVLLVPVGSDIRYNGNLESFMRQHSLGLYQDKAVDAHFETLRRETWARIDVSVNARQNMIKLLHGRFDAAIENDLTALYELRQLGREGGVRILRPPLNEVPAYITFARAGRLVPHAEAFDRALAAFRKTPAFDAIHRRYLGETK
ncbi:MAG TPA: transporter substrate-binding domain-containing protein [Burkholderiaceae bacterium]|nr:transporter substrate-binding domain-containing protein [Burkholderiaceae bacterium]